ncbi:hypothetical protein [Alkalimonas amylolytica]|nr:hypothetical protein [Alkalimonas amylolytica]
MLDALVHTERYNQRDFVIDGYLSDGYLYFSPEQAKHQDTSYAIALRTEKAQPIDLRNFNEHWVFINGRLVYEHDAGSYAGSSVLVVREISNSF